MTAPNPAVRLCSSQTSLRVPRRKITDLVAFVARAEHTPPLDVDIAVVGADEMAQLNEQYHRYLGATDVLSFDLSDGDDNALTAQIIVCADVALEEAAKRKLRPQRELLLYVLHGLLHLLGYDDTSKPKARRMHARQAELLEAFLS